MVKGNWERRAELASLRREEEKERKAQRKAGDKVPSSEAVVSRLRGEGLVEGCRCWLDQLDAEAEVCHAYFRSGECLVRRCKYPHLASPISHLSNLAYPLGDGLLTERPCSSTSVALADISSKEYRSVRFISVGTRCVYDASAPSVWRAFSETFISRAIERLTIKEEVEGEEEADGDEDGDAGDKERKPNAFIESPKVLSLVLSFLSVQDVFGSLVVVSRSLKKGVLSDGPLRERKRAAFGAAASHLSKMKKIEQKKKSKAAFVGEKDKVDAYARGISR
jgi:hypothetical protein